MKNAWNWIAKSILQFKFPLLGFIFLLTFGLSFKASQIQLSYELAKILPKTDEHFQLYEGFKKKYGEDGAQCMPSQSIPECLIVEVMENMSGNGSGVEGQTHGRSAGA